MKYTIHERQPVWETWRWEVEADTEDEAMERVHEDTSLEPVKTFDTEPIESAFVESTFEVVDASG